jgi:hypothetical protein
MFLAFLVAGCGPDPIEEVLTLDVPPYSIPVEIDSFCNNGGCTGQDDLTIILSFKDDAYLAEDAQVEFLQYRVDYQLNEIEEEIPYFAALATVIVYPGSTTSLSIATAGYAQRNFIHDRVGEETVKGTAHLTLAGFDHVEELVLFDAVFAVKFGDFVDVPVTPPEEEESPAEESR